MAWYKPWTWGDESNSTKEQRSDLRNQANQADAFRDYATTSAGALGTEAGQLREALRRRAEGKDSLSAEQLRQGLQQQYALQRSMAASASPQNAAMAARTAMMNTNRAATGMAGNAAMAGIQERLQAEKALQDMILGQRQQDIQASLGAGQNAIGALTGYKPEGSFIDKWGPAIAGGLGYATKSDRRAKTDIKDGDAHATKALEKLGSYDYRYKDERDGKGEQFGVMAQDLEDAGLGHAVINTSKGKYVDGGKLSTSNTALVAALARRVKKLEEGKK
jgi:hypothetical protein